jgi:hypothetical protein
MEELIVNRAEHHKLLEEMFHLKNKLGIKYGSYHKLAANVKFEIWIYLID